MDGWTVLWAEGTFSASRYLAFVVSALPVTAIYAVSNVLFLLVLAVPIGGKLDRVIKNTEYDVDMLCEAGYNQRKIITGV